MRVVFFVAYGVMAVWLVIAAVLRVVLSLRAGIPLDVLPAVTGGLGLLALILAAPRVIDRVRHRPRPPSTDMIEVPPDFPGPGPAKR